MHEEKVDVSDAGKPGENGEPSNQNAPGTSDLTISQKYRELRNRLKYLIYVSPELCAGAGSHVVVFFSTGT